MSKVICYIFEIIREIIHKGPCLEDIELFYTEKVVIPKDSFVNPFTKTVFNPKVLDLHEEVFPNSIHAKNSCDGCKNSKVSITLYYLGQELIEDKKLITRYGFRYTKDKKNKDLTKNNYFNQICKI